MAAIWSVPTRLLANVGAVYAIGAYPQRLDAAWLQPAPDELTSLSLLDASARLKAKTVTSVQLTQACLTRIERLQPVLNAFITVTSEQAVTEARAADAEIAAGKWRGALHGVPIALKDIVDTTGVRTTGASALFKDRVPAVDAEVVTRLRAAGAVMLGKLNLHEFAYGGTSCYSHFGPVHNPWNPDYIASGSSGGSGAAVAGRLCFGALGTDTGGSIRQPSAHCGIIGLKGTYRTREHPGRAAAVVVAQSRRANGAHGGGCRGHACRRSRDMTPTNRPAPNSQSRTSCGRWPRRRAGSGSGCRAPTPRRCIPTSTPRSRPRSASWRR